MQHDSKQAPHTQQQLAQLVSALVDGELRGAEFAQALDLLRTQDEARANWHDYQLIGDVLRHGEGAAVGAPDEAFLHGLRQRLVSVAPRSGRMWPAASEPQSGRVNADSANDAVWRWKLVAGLCSLAVVALLGWQVLAFRPSDDGAQLAQAVPVAPTAPATDGVPQDAVMIRDPQLDELIAAHQQQGGTSALQMPAGFFRNATFERPAR